MMVQKPCDKTSIALTIKNSNATTNQCFSLRYVLFWMLSLFSLFASPIIYMVLTRAGLGQYFEATFSNTTAPFAELSIIPNDIIDGEIPLQVSCILMTIGSSCGIVTIVV